MIDAIAGQSHFADHIRPIWNALPPEIRGRFYEGSIPKGSRNHTLVASSSDMKQALAKGRPTAMMEHGCGQSFGGDPRCDKFSSYAGHAGRDGVDVFIHPGEHPAERDRKRYPSARVEVVGCPKLDTLPRGGGDHPPVVAVSFHWNCTICPETSSAFLAFRAQVQRLAKRYHVIGHGHPRVINRLGREYARLGIETIRSFEDVCRMADLYVNDCSSTLFEFASTGRPVVVLNDSRYRRVVNHGLRFWKAATVGVNVEESGDLVEGVARALDDEPAQRAARERALDLVYAYRTGAAQRAADVLVDWSEAKVRRVA